MVLVGFYLPLDNWALQGMEVGAAALVITLALLGILQDFEHPPPSPDDQAPRPRFDRRPYLWLAVATWIRPDLAVLGAGLVALSAGLDPNNRLARLRDGTFFLAAAIGLQTGLRLLYYGDPFPNTYYLKVAGVPTAVRIERGLLVYVAFLDRMWWIPLLLAVGSLFTHPSRGRGLLFGAFVIQSSYSVSVGGDAWEWWGGANRYLCVVIAPLFVLAVLGLRDLLPRRRLAYAAGVAFLLVLANNFNSRWAFRQWLLLEPPLHVENNREMVRMSRVLDGAVTKDGRIAVVWAGIVPYMTDRPCVDLLGKNDRRIAHMKVLGLTHPAAFIPGHIKYDYAYSIGQLRPDVVSDLVGEESEADPWLEPSYRKVVLDGFTFYFLKDSLHIVARDPNGK